MHSLQIYSAGYLVSVIPEGLVLRICNNSAAAWLHGNSETKETIGSSAVPCAGICSCSCDFAVFSCLCEIVDLF